MRQKHTAFFISDGTGITAEALGNSLLAQFDDTEFEKITIPYSDFLDKICSVINRINTTAEVDGTRPLINLSLVVLRRTLSARTGKTSTVQSWLKFPHYISRV